MRKFVIIPLVFLLTILTACSSKTATKPDTSGGFSCNVSISYDDSDYSAIITRIGQGVWEAELTSPETVNGMVLYYENGEVVVKYKGFSVNLPNSSVPMKTLLSQIFEAVDNIANNPDAKSSKTENGIVVEGEVNDCGYIITFDKDGKLLSVNIPTKKLTVTVESYN